jgi:hypothetical protein
MSEKTNPSNTISMEISPAEISGLKKNRIVMNQIFESVMKQAQNQPDDISPALFTMVKRRSMPDGTGQIINIGI